MTRRPPIDAVVAIALAGMGEFDLTATEDQLYYEACRVLLPMHRAPARPGFLLPRPLPRPAFDAALRRVVMPRPVPGRVRFATGPCDAPDLFDYAIPRVLVCQHDGLAAALVANDLHMDAATAILGPSDMACGPPPRLRAALAMAATPLVHLLHDATPAGAAWCATATPGWEPARIVPLGLRPVHARRLHLFRAPGGGAQLAAVPPLRLLRTLRRLLLGRRRSPAAWRARAGLGFLSAPLEVR